MNLRSTNLWSVVLAMMAVGCWAIVSNADEEPAAEQNVVDLNLDPVQSQLPQLYQQAQRAQGQAELAAKAFKIRLPKGSVSGSIQSAAEVVRDAKGDDAKAAAKKKLSDLLGKYFDDDMKRRQQELTQIEERLTKLRELLERRRAKKEDILELQTKVALNEADGLGFYDGEQPGGPKAVNGLFRTRIDASPFVSIQPPAAPLPAPVPVPAPEPPVPTTDKSGSQPSPSSR